MASSWVEAVGTLLREIYDGPEDPSGTWVVDNEPGSGIFGTLDSIEAAEASLVPICGLNSVVAHAHHLRYSLHIANTYARDEEPVHDWASSWAKQEAKDEEWAEVRAGLREEWEELLGHLESGRDRDQIMITGMIATAAHAAYHLGAIRQLVVRR